MEPLDYITMAPEEISKLLSAGNGDAALVYLYMKSTGDYRLSRVQEQLHLPESALGWAESLLKQLGLTKSAVPENRYDPARAPVYTADSLKTYAAQDPSFQLLQDEVSRRLGRLLSTEELKTLLAVRDYLHLPPEVVSMAVTYCLQRNEYYNRTNGTNRTITMRAIEHECYRWANLGINSLEQASEYINRNLKNMTPEAQIAKILQLDHPLVETERAYIRSWLDMGFEPEAIRLAYEKTLVGTGRMTWRYLNKILLNWNEQNLHTAAQVSAEAPPPDDKNSGYVLGQSELNAIANLEKLRDSFKEE